MSAFPSYIPLELDDVEAPREAAPDDDDADYYDIFPIRNETDAIELPRPNLPDDFPPLYYIPAMPPLPPPQAQARLDIHLKDVSVTELDADADCSICLNSIHESRPPPPGGVAGSSPASPEKVKSLPCSHVYHEGCIRQWLAVKSTCPLCRSRLK